MNLIIVLPMKCTEQILVEGIDVNGTCLPTPLLSMMTSRRMRFNRYILHFSYSGILWKDRILNITYFANIPMYHLSLSQRSLPQLKCCLVTSIFTKCVRFYKYMYVVSFVGRVLKMLLSISRHYIESFLRIVI